MESIERLGYELRVFIRVPDLGKKLILLWVFALNIVKGDGQDRERYRDKSGSGKSSGGGKSAQSSSSPVTTTFPGSQSSKKSKSIGHVRRISGNTSAESGSGGGAGSGNAASGGSLHPYHGIINNSVTQTKVKYREQGVDELLQLKLHQALAETDDVVPDGSTIVLATGDGNVGQFNEDGFLGPVRTALRRGWKVELYAWEDGLSGFFVTAIKLSESEYFLWQAALGDASLGKAVNSEGAVRSASSAWNNLLVDWLRLGGLNQLSSNRDYQLINVFSTSQHIISLVHLLLIISPCSSNPWKHSYRTIDCRFARTP